MYTNSSFWFAKYCWHKKHKLPKAKVTSNKVVHEFFVTKIFYALLDGTICFVQIVSSKTMQTEASDWIVENFHRRCEGGLLGSPNEMDHT